MRKSILACVVVALVVGATSATAATLITGKEIKDGTLTAADIKRGSIKASRLTSGLQRRIALVGAQGGQSAPGAKGDKGADGASGTRGDKGDKGDKGDPAPHRTAGNWGIINRNTIGAPATMLRSGPGEPPHGEGSLNLLVPNGTEKIAFGNESDFAGMEVADIDEVGLSVYNGFDPSNAWIPAGIAFEVDPNVVDGQNYSSLVYVPPVPTAGERNTWVSYDADDAAPGAQSGWYFTNGATAAATGCGQGAGQVFCSWTEIQAKAPAAVVTYSVAISKGRDTAFSGAVDGLRINDTVFDFEETGVVERGA